MIGKKISNPRRSASKAERISALAEYVRSPEGADIKEKCVYSGTRGFISDLPDVQALEMIALAEEATRSRDPVQHYVLSWREGEQPAAAQVEDAVTILLHELGLEEHQVIYGLHADSHNQHVHVLVNRVHPETLKCIEINRGFDIEVIHRAVARIEHTQGWQRERNGRYVVLADGQLARSASEQKQSSEPNQQRRDMENRTGEKSVVRVAKENAGDVFRTATSWDELHSRLATGNMRYERTGSGAVIFVGDVAVKASSVDRAASLAKLEKKFGAFQPSNEATQRASLGNAKRVTQQPVVGGLPGWDKYTAERQAHIEERFAARLELRCRHDAERKAMQKRNREARQELFASRDWAGRGIGLNALRSVLAAEQAAERASLIDRQSAERKQLTARLPAFPSLEEWLRQRQMSAVAALWRYRADIPQEIAGDKPAEDASAVPADDIRAFRPRVSGKQVEYIRRDALDDLLFSHRASFVDCGSTIQVYDWRDERSALAALQLAAQKWGSFSLRGSSDYKALCVRLAAEHGLRIKNPELQDAIERERERVACEREYARKSDRQRQFERYAAAVQADRYRITYVRTWPDGGRQPVVMGGRVDGYTVQEVARRARHIDGLRELEYTPISDGCHHVVIRAMTREQARKFLVDGYKPAVLVESGTDSFEAVVNIGEHSGNSTVTKIGRILNERYGNATPADGILSHRAPEISGSSPSDWPGIRLRYAEHHICSRSGELMQELRARSAPVREEDPQIQFLRTVGTAADAYRVHRADLMVRQIRDALDVSSIDAAVAVRLRVTGHSRAEVEHALKSARVGEEVRDWDAYVRRAADFAFGEVGNREAVRLARYRERWLELEGRFSEPVSRPTIPIQK
ncbi:relaxase/mobilization nuclease domain-containing protein [Paraburkholderia edwinii]|uniref:Relaxase/mobilization nuclease domain-containing protein n=1 Tax=Paraburkholderia edwinii TaxID=2861782 RepID=A0ABX8UMA4_9BURK|nr:TraI/MobA(P) family conjugative relaxase [Paraburkholderia edwinii]QYD70079.1 relaxase/mobilization nuclease domain-containing protein [Paraburkholderia edwinii]